MNRAPRPACANGIAAARPETARNAWIFVFILLGSTIINFIDRQTLSVLAPILRDEFHLSNSQYAAILNAFQISYLVMYSVGGRLADLLGVRRGMTLFVLWWSLASIAQMFVMGPRSLAACRFLLAVGEGGNWPAVVKAVGERIPGPMRSLAVGVVNSGSSLGAAIAPPLVGWLAITWGWRAAFLFTGLLGLIWLPLWLWYSREQGPGGLNRMAAGGLVKPPPWSRVFRYRQAWAVFLGRFIGDPVWFFYVFWLPEYLKRQRGLSIAAIASVAWIPFLAADAGNVAGGGATAWLMRRGWSVNRARKTVMTVASFGAAIGIVAAYDSTLAGAITCISFATFFYVCWAVNNLTLPVDFFPPSYVGTIFGFAGTGSGLGTMAAMALIGLVLDWTHNYTPVMIAIGLLLPAAQAVVALAAGPIHKLEISGEAPVS